MIFSVDQKELTSIIQDVQRAVASHTSMPILSGILIKTVGSEIILCATDLEIGIESRVNGEITEEGAVVLPAQHFSSIIRELPAATILFKMEGENTVHIDCLQSNYTIKGFDPEDFPPLPQIEGGTTLKLPQGRFKKIIDEVKFAASTDENQPFLNGALLQLKDGKMEMVATNTYRLACRQFELPAEINSEDIEVIVPLKTLQELGRLLSTSDDEVSITRKMNHLLFSFAPITITSRVKEGQFPNYRQVVPTTFTTNCTIKRQEILQAVRRASLIARGDSNTVEFIFKEGILNLSTRDSKIGQAHEEVAIEQEGPEIHTAFTADYVIDVLRIIEHEKVTMSLVAPNEPCVIRGLGDEEYLYLIMPIRL